MYKCTECKTVVKKLINKVPGEILGKYVCNCKFGQPKFPLVKVDEGK